MLLASTRVYGPHIVSLVLSTLFYLTSTIDHYTSVTKMCEFNHRILRSDTHAADNVPMPHSLNNTIAFTRAHQVCAPVTACWTSSSDMAGQWIELAATMFNDNQCAPLTPPCSTFSTPHYETVAPTPTSDRQCAVQPTCTPPSTYEAVAPTNTSARVCLPTTSCGMDLIQSVAPTYTTDRVCIGCQPGQVRS